MPYARAGSNRIGAYRVGGRTRTVGADCVRDFVVIGTRKRHAGRYRELCAGCQQNDLLGSVCELGAFVGGGLSS